jgi:hypothetical protein
MLRVSAFLVAGLLLTFTGPAGAEVRVVVCEEEAITFENEAGAALEVWILSESVDAWARANCVKLGREHYNILKIKWGGRHKILFRHPGKHYVFLANPRTGVENHLGWICLRDLRKKVGPDVVTLGLRHVWRTTNTRDNYGRPVTIKEKYVMPDIVLCNDGHQTFYTGHRFDMRQGKPAR